MTSLTSQQLRQAADIQDKIENLQVELNDLLSGGGSAARNGSQASAAATPKKRVMSAAGRAKIAAAARARWAKVRAQKK